VLRPLQEIFDPESYPDLLVGLGQPDDAAVWRLDDARSLAVTIDFFTPVVDDPFDYGRIAAANALSDLYAMGARPLLALNVLAIPPALPASVAMEIMRGGALKVREAGAVLAGGHSIHDEEPKYGLVAVGMVPTERIMTKTGARPGDVLVLTKPLGTGVIATALKRQAARDEDVAQAVDWMARLNAAAAALALSHKVRGATDVTGFSLLGHASEMAAASGVRIRFHLPAIPFFQSARRYAEGAHFPGGSADNRLYFGPKVHFDDGIDEYNQMLLFDAQTSGGLLLAVPPSQVESMFADAAKVDQPIWAVGAVEEGEGVHVSRDPLAAPPGPREALWFADA